MCEVGSRISRPLTPGDNQVKRARVSESARDDQRSRSAAETSTMLPIHPHLGRDCMLFARPHVVAR
jgi:hypothetical protein